jgi:multiple sugar transport system permease protein
MKILPREEKPIKIMSLKIKPKKKRSFILLNIIIISLFASIALYPVLLVFTNSFMTSYEIIHNYLITQEFRASDINLYQAFVKLELIPNKVTIRQYSGLLIDTPIYLKLFWNSVKLTLPVTVGQVVVSSLAAFSFVRSKWRFKEFLFAIYIIIMLMPQQVTLVPNFITARMLHIEKSYLAIILPGIFSPFGVFILRQFMKTIPSSYFEAAEIDGANNWDLYAWIVLPMVKPALMSLSILIFIEYWNVVDQAIIFINEAFRQPLSVFLADMPGSNAGFIFAASAFYMLFPLLVYMNGFDYLAQGIQNSGLKE